MSAGVRHIVVPGIPVLQEAFCHASIANNVVWIAGTCGTYVDKVSGANKLIDGGVYDQTTLILESIEKILKASGTAMKYVTNLKIFVTNNTPQRYKQMNDAYVGFFKERGLPVCSRITVGCSVLPLGADVKIDGSAVLPPRARL